MRIGASSAGSEPFGLWGRAFRPFFLAAALHALLVVPWWVLIWSGVLAGPTWLAPMYWHGHEMVFGFTAAAIAGFLLTAAPVWSGGAALRGKPLATLVCLWLLGRLALTMPGMLPPWLIATIDLAFLPGVALATSRTLWGSGQRRNHAIVGIVLVLAAANAAMHAEAVGLAAGIAGLALRFAVDGVLVLILVVAGRITPVFTQNAFRLRGIERDVRVRPWLDALAIGTAGALALTPLVLGRSALTGLLAMAAGLAVALRLVGWQSWHVRADPLLWSLHAGSLWLAVGFLLVAASDLGLGVPPTAGLHALTAGAIGASILAVMTRVGLGHTGRALETLPGIAGAYALVNGGAAARVAAACVTGPAHLPLLFVSGLAWAAAFAIFLFRYAPILTAPRADGRPG